MTDIIFPLNLTRTV